MLNFKGVSQRDRKRLSGDREDDRQGLRQGAEGDHARSRAKFQGLLHQAAGSKVPTIDKANSFYEKGATVANSGELGGLPASRFIQGNGHVSTGALSGMADGSARQTLLSVPGTNGEIIVVCQPAPVGQPGGIQVLIHNGTSQGVPAVQDGAADHAKGCRRHLADHDRRRTRSQVQLQTFPTSALSQVMTLTISGEPTPSGVSVVGQMLNGAG